MSNEKWPIKQQIKQAVIPQPQQPERDKADKAKVTHYKRTGDDYYEEGITIEITIPRDDNLDVD